MTLRTLILFIITFTLISCDKNENAIAQNECDDGLTKSIVYNTGPIAVDGCNWIISINNMWFSPTNLEMEYQIDSNVLFIDYVILADTFTCGLGAGLLKIELLDVCQE